MGEWVPRLCREGVYLINSLVLKFCYFRLMQKLVLLFGLSLIIFSCNENKEGSSLEKQGIQKTYYPNGQLKYEWNWKDGKRDGIQKTYHPNGLLKTKKKYKDGILIKRII